MRTTEVTVVCVCVCVYIPTRYRVTTDPQSQIDDSHREDILYSLSALISAFVIDRLSVFIDRLSVFILLKAFEYNNHVSVANKYTNAW